MTAPYVLQAPAVQLRTPGKMQPCGRVLCLFVHACVLVVLYRGDAASASLSIGEAACGVPGPLDDQIKVSDTLFLSSCRLYFCGFATSRHECAFFERRACF